MAQSCTVMAFRKRLKSYGYTEIEIIKIKGYYPERYKIKAIEPLGKNLIETEYTTTEMHNSFK